MRGNGVRVCNSKLYGVHTVWAVTDLSLSLLFRYSLIYQPTSTVAICKVTHDQKVASFGLKARRMIGVGTFIKETCSSMSLDITQDQGPSIIEATGQQMAPAGRRLILGPFRLVNHDCNPNAQVGANGTLL